MKKIVSLVLALVLVLAFAAPAMAITGLINPTVTTSAYGPYVDIDLALIESPASGLGILSLQAVAANKAYVKDALVHFALYYKTTASGSITANPEDYIDPAALISSDVVSFLPSTVNEYRIDSAYGITSIIANGVAVAPATPVVTWAAATPKQLKIDLESPGATAMSYVILGSGVLSTAANGTILAEVMGDQTSSKFMPLTVASVDGAITALDGSSIFTGKLATDIKYTIFADYTPGVDTITYAVVLPTASGDTYGNAVIFTASHAQTIGNGSTHNLSKIEVTLNQDILNAGGTALDIAKLALPATQKYLVVDQGSILAGGGASALKFYLGGAEETVAATITKLTAAYTGVMTTFGFNYSAAGVLHPVHFGNKLSVFYAYDSAALTLYTSAITVPDADTDVPQTGDAATSIGFVMIALAIVAACGVAYKKVRA